MTDDLPHATGDDNRAAFASHALALRCSGFAVLPVALPDGDHEGKEPLIKYWSRWRQPPSLKAIETWMAKFADANLAIQPGASRVLVADIDDADQMDEAINALGDTPLRVATRRGQHLYFKSPDQPLPGTLQALGIKGELKFGPSIVIAPPSIHKSGTQYELLHDGWVPPHKLPLPKLGWLEKASDIRPRSGRGHSRRHTHDPRLETQAIRGCQRPANRGRLSAWPLA